MELSEFLDFAKTIIFWFFICSAVMVAVIVAFIIWVIKSSELRG